MAKIFTRAVYFNLCLLFISFSPIFAQSPCDQTQVTLQSQADVDNFPSQFCSTLCSLTISGSDITNLDSLYILETVATLTITFNPVLTDISGLSNISSISGPCGPAGLTISGNNLLSNVDGLSSLVNITGMLSISSNTMLTNLDGLSNLETITATGGSSGLSIASNASLENIDGLSAITSIGGSLGISGNPGLTNISGLNSVATISGAAWIGYNDALASLDGLASLQTIGLQVSIQQNSQLQNIRGLSNLEHIGQFSPSGEALTIADNAVLTSLDGLQKLDTIAGTTFIERNESLLDLNGLSSLRSLGDGSYNSGIRVNGNASLIDVSGIGNIEVISGGRASYLEITSNPSLVNINLPGLKGIFGDLVGRLNIASNADLLNLDGLSSLEYVHGGMSAVVRITGNESLQDIDGLSSLARVYTVNDFTIADNVNLGRFCGLYKLFHDRGIGCGSPQCYSTAQVHIAGNERNPTPEQIEAEGPCDALMTQPTNLVFSQVTSEGMKVTFNNASTFTSGYLVLMKSYGPAAPEDVPQDGTSYHVGQVLGSSSIVVHVGSDTTFTVSGLEPSTPYYFDVFSWKTTENGNDYLTAGPLEGHQSTTGQTALAGTLSFIDVTSEAMTVSLGETEPGNYMALMKAYGSPSPNDVPVNGRQYNVGNTVGSSTIVVNIGTGSPFTVNGLVPGVRYHFDVYKYDPATFVYDAGPKQGSQSTENENSGARIASQEELQPYPNPFDGVTSIPFVVEEESTVHVVIYDMTGREIEVLTSGTFGMGRHEASWNGADKTGRRVNPGVYVYSVKTEGGVVTGRVAVR